MSLTISYTPIGANAHYTIAELNALFTNLAVVINGKLDVDGYADANVLTDDIGFNLQPIINLAEGIEDDDAVTVGQVKRILGIE